MLSAEAAARIRSDHRDLRALLVTFDEIARRVQDRSPGALSELRRAMRELDTVLRAHLVMEESALVPVLPAPAVARMHTEHAGQRAALLALTHDVELDARGPAELADDVRWLARGILRDMRDEDAALDHLAVNARVGQGER